MPQLRRLDAPRAVLHDLWLVRRPEPHRVKVHALLYLLSNAVCGDKDPLLWDADTPESAAPALDHCATCTVRSECLTRVMGPKRTANFTGVAGGVLWVDGKRQYLPPR